VTIRLLMYNLGETMSELIPLTISIEHTDADESELYRITQNLVGELERLGAENVTMDTSVPQSDGSKSGELITVGAIALTILPVTIPALIQWLQEWTLRDRRGTIKIRKDKGSIEFEIPDSLSPEQLKSYIDLLKDEKDK
jgi:hypothetical protein